MPNKKKIGIINSGGDCPGLNTVIDAVVKSLKFEFDEVEILGFYKGFEGLLEKKYIELTPEVTSPYKFEGGTFLKSVNKGNFATKQGLGKKRIIPEEIIQTTVNNYKDLGLDCLVVLGGDGTMSIISALEEHGLEVIGVPKSIDNDLLNTDFTFGFYTAVEIATEALDRLETTAYSHDRVMILEVMGRNAGWISLFSGLAGGANIILIPEIPFEYKNILDFIKQRNQKGKQNTLIVVAEGASAKDEEVTLKNNFGESSESLLGGVGEKLEKILNKESGIEARSTVLGHIQRGGSPTSFDRVISRNMGVHATNLIKQGKFGNMVIFKDGKIQEEEISKCVNRLKLVDPKSTEVQTARKIGVCFGD
jgi:6-phosphofructokinase 1